MKFLTDENVSPSTVQLLRESGHDVLDIKETKRYGMTDDEVFALAQADKRILFTLDTDFLDQSRFPPGQCGGIIVCRMSPSTPRQINPRIEALLRSVSERRLNNKVVVLEERRWHFPRSPRSA